MVSAANCKSIYYLCLYLGAILDKNDVWGTPSSLSSTTNKLRLLLFMWMPMYMFARERRPKGCWNQIKNFRYCNEIEITSWMASSCEYINFSCPTSNTKSPPPLSKKKAACTYFSYSLLILTHNVLRCGIMKLVEQKRKKKNSHKKLNVVLSCAYLFKVVLWGNNCWQGLCSPCLGPPLQQHLLGENRSKVTHLEMFLWPIAQRWKLR